MKVTVIPLKEWSFDQVLEKSALEKAEAEISNSHKAYTRTVKGKVQQIKQKGV